MKYDDILQGIEDGAFRQKLSSDKKWTIYYEIDTDKEVHRKINLRPGDKVIRSEQMEVRKKHNELEKSFAINKRKGFVQMKRAIKDVIGKVRQYHSHLFMKLLPIVSFEDKPLSINGKPLNQTKIAEYLGIHRKVASDFLKNLIEIKILEKCNSESGRNIYYKLCKEYIIKGEFEEPEEYTVKVLQNQLKKAIDLIELETDKYLNRQKKNKMELYPLSLLLTLLPYVHFQSHIICDNYDDNFLEKYPSINMAIEHDKRLIKRLTDKQIWNEMTGQNAKQLSTRDKKKFDTYFEILKKTNVLASLEGKNKIYLVNPNIVFVRPYLLDESWTNTLRGLFRIIE